MFDIATPNPTGSLSGPWFDVTGSGNVTGVRGRNSHLACRVKNLANQTVSQQKICLRPFARYRRILAAPQRTKVDAKKFALSKSAQLTKITFLVSSLEFLHVSVQKLSSFELNNVVGVQSCKVSKGIRVTPKVGFLPSVPNRLVLMIIVSRCRGSDTRTLTF